MSNRALGVACVIACLAPAALSNAQSLAGAAKKAQETTTKTGKDTPSAKTYSNDDLKRLPSETLPPKTTEPVAAGDKAEGTKAETPKSETASAKDETKTEAYWRGRVAPIRRRLTEKRDKLAATAKRVAELTFELTGIGPLNARRGGVETERQRLITEANALQIDIEADQKALSNVEEEGRRAGALPGWLRD